MNNLKNAEKYTPQFGFERGVVVEIIRNSGSIEVGMFEKVYGGDIELIYKREYSGQTASLWFNPENIKSIRVLTGPFAAWQFAPAGTVAIHFDKANQKIQFCDALDPAPWEYDEDWILAPWWHQPKESKNAKED